MGSFSQDDIQKLQLENPVDYKDIWPDVECTIKIKRCENFNVCECTFFADFVVNLDWLDFSLIECVHFKQNVKNHKWTLASWVLNNPGQFNPIIRIDNAVEGQLEMMPNSDNFPQIERLITTQENEDSPLRDVPWLTKKYRFRGMLNIPDSNAKSFPFDVQRLPIKVVAEPLDGLTTFGKKRFVNLTDPVLRFEIKRYEKQREKALKNRQRESGGNNRRGSIAPIWDEKKKNLERVIAHEWPKSSDGSGFKMGEMSLAGFGGQDPDVSEYRIDMIMVRDPGHYHFDFLIQDLQVICAMFSFAVPINADCMANRASITLTVVLTLVAFTTQRPAVIENLHYTTVHDWYEQLMVFYTVIVALSNCMVALTCVGVDLDNPNYLESDYDGICEQGFFGPNFSIVWFDSIVFLLIMVLLLYTITYYIAKGQIERMAELILLHRELHLNDKKAAERNHKRMKRVRVAFPLSHGRIEIIKVSDLESLRNHCNVASTCWVIENDESNPLVLGSNPNFPLRKGHCLRLAGNKSLEDLNHLTQHLMRLQHAKISPDNSPVIWPNKEHERQNNKLISLLPFHFNVTDENVQSKVNRLMITPPDKSNDLVSYKDELDSFLVMRLIPSTKITNLIFAPLFLWLARNRVNQQILLNKTLINADTLSIKRSRLTRLLSKGQVVPEEEDEKPKELPACTEFNGEFDPNMDTYILDCGTGEIGFYTYSIKDGYVDCFSAEKKFELKNGFFHDFVNHKDGPQLLAQKILEKFCPRLKDGMSMVETTADETEIEEVYPTANDNNDQPLIPRARISQFTSNRKAKLFAGCTGRNREYIFSHFGEEGKLSAFLEKVSQQLSVGSVVDGMRFVLHANVLPYVPLASVEAEYELIATEYLVQHGDLDVSGYIPPGPKGQKFANFEILDSLSQNKETQANGLDVITVQAFINEFRDLETPYEGLNKVFNDAREAGTRHGYVLDDHRAPINELCIAIESDPAMMRALARARLFYGTLSAGGGSCQCSYKSKEDADMIVLESIPLGNRTPLDKLPNGEPSKWSKEKAVSIEQQNEWRLEIRTELETRNIPMNLRGFFIGISAVYYALLEAGIHEKVLPRDLIIEALEIKIANLTFGSKNYHKNVSNLILVSEWLRWILSDKSFMCAKRNWVVENRKTGHSSKLIATWSLGFWLNYKKRGPNVHLLGR